VSIILSFWELLDIFPWYLFSGFFLQVVGRYQQQEQEQSLDLSKLKKVSLFSLFGKFLGFLKPRLLKWTLLIKSFWIVEYGQIHGVNLCAFFMALWKSRDTGVFINILYHSSGFHCESVAKSFSKISKLLGDFWSFRN
jgi:hypothetical protein